MRSNAIATQSSGVVVVKAVACQEEVAVMGPGEAGVVRSVAVHLGVAVARIAAAGARIEAAA